MYGCVVAVRYPTAAEQVLMDPILYGDYKHAMTDGGSEVRLYEDLGRYQDIKPVFEEVLEAYNQKNKPMQLVLFEDALEHLTRIERTLRLPQASVNPLPAPHKHAVHTKGTETCMLISIKQMVSPANGLQACSVHRSQVLTLCVCGVQGNCLLVGVGGSGKQSLARLGAYTAGCGVFEISLTRGYDEAAFREDLKKLYTKLGAEDKKMLFLFTDSHVADEGFLELINNMLTSGAVTTAECTTHVCSVLGCSLAYQLMPPLHSRSHGNVFHLQLV